MGTVASLGARVNRTPCFAFYIFHFAFFISLLFCIALACPSWSAEEAWSELQSEGLLLRFRESDRALAGTLLGDLIAGRAVIARKLGWDGKAPVTAYLAPTEAEFGRLTQGRIPHWGIACAFPESGILVLRKLPGQSEELLRTARHEMAHILLHRAAGRVPVWFNEGVAMWAAGEWRLQQSAEVFWAVLSDGVIPLSDIDRVLQFSSHRAHLAYTESILAVTYLIHLGGSDAVAGVVSEMAQGAPFDVALYRVTGYPLRRFEQAWGDYVRGRFSLKTLLISPEVFWFYLALLFLAAYVGVRIRNRRMLRQWETEDPTDALPLRLRLQVRRREDQP